ncbi:HAD-IC family P-type ATPase, partial [Microbacterium sp.]|uniref:HAD-IC family P-type ATPase n=1 Tax=Microbacterium sp. TaxID=51671 RepID=UPI0028A1961D
MGRVLDIVRRYPWVAAAILVAIAGLVMQAAAPAPATAWFVSAFCLVVAVVQAWGMLKELLAGTVGLDVLAITAIVSTVVVGDYWASLVVVLMITGGQALEDYATARAKREVTALLDRSPQHAHRRSADGTTTDVPVADVRVGDILVVKPGEAVPVDADLESPAAAFDESSLTGESVPVSIERGGRVLSGAVNGETVVTVRAAALARDSQYQQIVALVQAAAGSKARFVRLADRFAVPFSIVAFGIAGIAWALSGDAMRFAQVLVVATPCPLLIAAPVAFIGGMSRAAHNGVIVKSGTTLERLARVRTAAFDKTGTLTHGHPEFERVDA